MKKYHYSCRIKTNAEGFVAQKTDEIAGEKILKRSGFFANLEVLAARLAAWTGGMYEFFLSPEDLQTNHNASFVPYGYARCAAHPGVQIGWYGPQGHDYSLIIPQKAGA